MRNNSCTFGNAGRACRLRRRLLSASNKSGSSSFLRAPAYTAPQSSSRNPFLGPATVTDGADAILKRKRWQKWTRPRCATGVTSSRWSIFYLEAKVTGVQTSLGEYQPSVRYCTIANFHLQEKKRKMQSRRRKWFCWMFKHKWSMCNLVAKLVHYLWKSGVHKVAAKDGARVVCS